MDQKGFNAKKPRQKLKSKKYPAMNTIDPYSKKNALSYCIAKTKPGITKYASKREFKSSFVVSQNNLNSPQKLLILSMPQILQWSFITKIHPKKTKAVNHKRILSENNPSLIVNHLVLSSPIIKTSISNCDKTTKRKYLSTRSNYDDNHYPNMSNTITSQRRSLKRKSVSSFRQTSSTSVNCDQKQEFYIKNQKIPYLKSISLSTMSVYSPTITAYNVDKCTTKRLKLATNNDINDNNSKTLLKTEEQKYFINKDAFSITKDEVDISMLNYSKIKNTELGTIETDNNNNNNANSHSNYHHLSKKTNNFINTNLSNSKPNNSSVNKSNRVLKKANAKTTKKSAIRAYNEYEYDFLKLMPSNKKNRSISPNKRLISYLFKDKGKLGHHRSLSLISNNTLKRDHKEVLPQRKNSSSYIFSNNTQFTYEGAPITQKQFCNNNLFENNTKPISKYEIYHNDNISIENSKEIIEVLNIPTLPINDFQTIDEDFSIENSHNESLTNMDHVNHINVQEVLHFFKNKIKSKSSLSFSSHLSEFNQIKPTPLIDEKDIEINIAKLKPIDTNKSLTKINILLDQNNFPKLNSDSKNFDSKADSMLSMPLKPKFLSIEQILNEVKLSIEDLFNAISSYDLNDYSNKTINDLFYLNNHNISHIKRLISVETIIPKGNLQRFTILKKNSSLQDILLHELVDIKTKKEKADNINLIIELIGNSNLILKEIMKDYPNSEHNHQTNDIEDANDDIHEQLVE